MTRNGVRRGENTGRGIRIALALVVVLAAGSYLAVTKELPFKHRYELKAVFANAANVRAGSPVRIAGVDVGEVRSVSGSGDNGVVTFTVDDSGRPVRDDATVEIRPRIFLEGNFFLDLKPGTPNAPELDDNGTIPVTQTSTAVQLDEVLTTLQQPSRENLQALLEGLGTGLNARPPGGGKTGAEGINGAFKNGGRAGRGTAEVNEAFLGTDPHDISDLVAAGDTTFRALASRETQLRDLVSNFNTTAGAFAAESDNLGLAVQRLGPTVAEAAPALRKLNDTLPALRRFSIDLAPSVAELPATFSSATPWIAQVRPLLGGGELGGLASQLQRAAPGIGSLTHSSLGLFPQLEQTSRCVSDVLIPTGNVTLSDPVAATGQPNYRELFYAAVGLAGESQGFDGNGPFLRFQSGGGPVQVSSNNPGGGAQNDRFFGNTIAPPQGTLPALGSKPQFRTDVPCAENAVPDLNGSGPGPASPAP